MKNGRSLSDSLKKNADAVMSTEEIEACLVTFVAHDILQQGSVRLCDLAAILQTHTGHMPRTEEVFEVRLVGGVGGSCRNLG